MPAVGAVLLAAALPCVVLAADPLRCETRQSGFGTVELGCLVPASDRPQRVRIVASFSGVHDDSRAAMQARRGDQPVACDAGGQLQFQGETQGDTLLCSFTLPAGEGSGLLLGLQWNHAEPATFSATRD